jgi:hypothetical protein
MLWNSTHRDVHPQPTTYDELRDKTYAYAAAIKQADPSAKTLGPVLWGWCAYFFSARRLQCRSDYAGTATKRSAVVFTKCGVRTSARRALVDYLDLHYYPRRGVALRTRAMRPQALRLRSTRRCGTHLRGWRIGGRLGKRHRRLIPRMKSGSG